MTFRVRPLRKARQDVDAIFHWMINDRHAPQGAKAWCIAYEAALRKLAISADQHGLAPESEHSKHTLRQFFFSSSKLVVGGLIAESSESTVMKCLYFAFGAPVEPDEL